MFSGRYATRQGTYEVVTFTLVCRVVIPSLGGKCLPGGGGLVHHATGGINCSRAIKNLIWQEGVFYVQLKHKTHVDR